MFENYPVYDRNGQPITWERYCELLGDERDYKRVELTDVGAYTVSTVWLGINHRHIGPGAPIIFETLVFTRDGYWDDTSRNGMGEIDGRRYCTEDEARTGHRELVELIQATSIDLDTPPHEHETS